MRELSLVPFELPDAGELLPRLAEDLRRVYRLETRVMAGAAPFASCFDRVRGQYEAHRLLAELGTRRSGAWVLGVTDSDLFVPVFTFVLGNALLDGAAAVVSTHRLRDELYGLSPDPERLKRRLSKTAVHELGHCFGLRHCHDSSCAMFAAASVEDVDLKSDDLCERCRTRLSG